MKKRIAALILCAALISVNALAEAVQLTPMDLMFQRMKDALDVIDLLGRAQISRVHRIKGNLFLLPVGNDVGHILRQVAEGVSRKTRRVGRQHSRRQHAGFQSASRQDR